MTRRFFLLLAIVGLAHAAPLAAQRRAGVEIAIPARERLLAEGPQVSARGILGDAELRELVRSGFPARLHFRVELWADRGWLNDLTGTREWDVILRYDALERSYRVYQTSDQGSGMRVGMLGSTTSYEEAQAIAERAVGVPMVPRRRGKYYYLAALEVETLSLTDLDELERWLRGELRPALADPADTPSALTRGVRTLFARLLGGGRQRYEGRSRAFSI